MLDIDPGMILWTWITFGIVLVLLSKLALKPILAAIENRESSIRSDIEKAQQQRDEAEALIAQHKEKMEAAEAEAQALLKESRKLADKAREEMLEKTRLESGKLLEKAKEEIEQQKESALASLRTEVADLAVGAAEKIILHNLDSEKQKAVVDEYIKAMPDTLKN